MNMIKRTFAALLSCLTVSVCAAACCISAAAAGETALRGDLNADGYLTAEDASLLAAHLTTSAALRTSAAEAADLNDDGILNAADLSLLKRRILEQPASDHLMKRPLDALSPTMPSTGKVRVLMILVSFPDCAHPADVTPEQVQANCFGPADPDSAAFPMESISAYYERASYGRLMLSGDVCACTVKSESQSYIGLSGKFMTEVLNAVDPEIDFTQYDSDADGCADAVIAVVPEALGKTDWLPQTGIYAEKVTFDGIRIGSRSYGSCDVRQSPAFNSTWAHELGHAMGLPDYYKYANTESGSFGLNGDAGWELMDDACGDLSAFSKLLLGWFSPSEVQRYTGGTQTFAIPCAQDAPGCVVIQRGDPDDYLSECFVLDYQRPDGNNYASQRLTNAYTLFREGGLRILHGDATICQGRLELELKWNNYGRYYDKTNKSQRVLRLINEAEGGGFFRTGDLISSGISGFRWYDEAGGQIVDPHLTVRVDSITDQLCTVTISEN